MRTEARLAPWAGPKLARTGTHDRRAAAGARAAGRALAIAAGALALAAASQLSLPWQATFVPLSAQPQAVLLVAAVLGPRRGPAAVFAWFALGLAGGPVFANAEAASALVGPKAGYLWSYPLVAALIGRAGRGGGFAAWCAWLVAAGVTLLLGTAGLSLLVGPRAAIALGFAPFWLADGLKATGTYLLYALVARPLLGGFAVRRRYRR